MPSLSPDHAEEMSDMWLYFLFVDWMNFFFLRIKKIGQLPLSSRNHSGKAFYYGFNLLNTKLF